ncbi:MAG: SGNH/GDSL hydrolase family protein [Bacteroidales bacterium]|nr:SGNH/GDSL hydrolase family protein [Bacteroidales bacterium]
MKRILVLLSIVLTGAPAVAQPLLHSQWEGARVAFLGDSITDARQIASTNNIYWNNLVDILGVEPYVYGISGHRMNQIVGQGERLEREHGQEVDAILVFIGTNDFNGNIPLGEWYTYSMEKTIDDGPAEVERKHRELVYDDATFRGRANTTLRWLKTHYPDKQIIFLTPIHRAYAKFNDKNIQPPESYANDNGYFIDDYVQAVKEISNVWAVPVIDLNSICGLYPLLDEHAAYFRNPDTDRLHPNTPGQLRMAWSIAYQLLGYPAAFPKYIAVEMDYSETAPALPENVLETLRDGDILRVPARDEAAVRRVQELVPVLERRGFTVLDGAAKLWSVRGIPAPEGNNKTNVY